MMKLLLSVLEVSTFPLLLEDITCKAQCKGPRGRRRDQRAECCPKKEAPPWLIVLNWTHVMARAPEQGPISGTPFHPLSPCSQTSGFTGLTRKGADMKGADEFAFPRLCFYEVGNPPYYVWLAPSQLRGTRGGAISPETGTFKYTVRQDRVHRKAKIRVGLLLLRIWDGVICGLVTGELRGSNLELLESEIHCIIVRASLAVSAAG